MANDPDGLGALRMAYLPPAAPDRVAEIGLFCGHPAMLTLWDDGRIEFAQPLSTPHPEVRTPFPSDDGTAALHTLRLVYEDPEYPDDGLDELIEAVKTKARQVFGPEWGKEGNGG